MLIILPMLDQEFKAKLISRAGDCNKLSNSSSTSNTWWEIIFLFFIRLYVLLKVLIYYDRIWTHNCRSITHGEALKVYSFSAVGLSSFLMKGSTYFLKPHESPLSSCMEIFWDSTESNCFVVRALSSEAAIPIRSGSWAYMLFDSEVQVAGQD